MAGKLPKLKDVGLVTATPSDGMATARFADYIVTWRTDLDFRQTKYQGVHEAICITEVHKDYHFDGLHLTPDAARRLAGDLNVAAAHVGSSVDINNHKNGQPQMWRRFSDADAMHISETISTVVAGK